MYVLCASLSNTHHASFEKYKYVGEGRVAHIAKIEREGEVKAHTHTQLLTYQLELEVGVCVNTDSCLL